MWDRCKLRHWGGGYLISMLKRLNWKTLRWLVGPSTRAQTLHVLPTPGLRPPQPHTAELKELEREKGIPLKDQVRCGD